MNNQIGQPLTVRVSEMWIQTRSRSSDAADFPILRAAALELRPHVDEDTIVHAVRELGRSEHPPEDIFTFVHAAARAESNDVLPTINLPFLAMRSSRP